MITKEKLKRGYILNDHGVLRQTFVGAAKFHGFDVTWMKGDISSLEGSVCFIDLSNTVNGYDEADFSRFQELCGCVPRRLSLEDFAEEEEEQKEKDEMETPVIDWSQAPEGYDYWIEYEGENPDFHKLHTRFSGVEVYSDAVGEYYLKDNEDIVVYKRPEPFETSKKYNYVPLEVESVFDLKDMFEKGEVYFKAIGDREDDSFGGVYVKIVDEKMLICRYEEKRLLKREEVKWQDVAQEFIKNDPVLSKDKFVEDMFGNEFKDYHEPLKQLAKLIVENTK